jgi:surface antigen
MNIPALILAFAAFLFPLSAVSAIDVRFLKETPIGKFSKEDLSMMQETARKALSEAPDGTLVEWSNPKTGSSGTIKPLDTFQQQGLKCRRAEVTNRYKTLLGGTTLVACEVKKGEWKYSTVEKK